MGQNNLYIWGQDALDLIRNAPPEFFDRIEKQEKRSIGDDGVYTNGVISDVLKRVVAGMPDYKSEKVQVVFDNGIAPTADDVFSALIGTGNSSYLRDLENCEWSIARLLKKRFNI